MKRTITTFAIILTLLAVEVHASQLIIRTNAFSAKAVISGDVFFSQDGQFHVTQLKPGKHFVTVSEKRGRGNNYRRGNGHRGGGQNVLFQGKVFVPQGSKVFARITPRGRLVIDQVIPSGRRGHNNGPSCGSRSGQGRDYGNGSGRDYNRGGDNRNGRNGDNRDYSRGVQSNFEAVIDQIQRSSFDSDKKIIATQFLTTNDVTSSQVLQMVKQFDFESTKLDVAKKAYHSTVDPENYFIVNDGFGFSSSINSLDRYIRKG